MKETNKNLNMEKDIILLGLNVAFQITFQIPSPVHKDEAHREQNSMNENQIGNTKK